MLGGVEAAERGILSKEHKGNMSHGSGSGGL